MKGEENITGRIIDLIAPIGKGQRALIVAAQDRQDRDDAEHRACHGANHPRCHLIVLLVDERPGSDRDAAHREGRG